MGIKKIIKLSVLLSGITYAVAGHSTTIQLDFTTYTTHKSVCSSTGCTNYDYYDNPIVSDYRFVLDMSDHTNTVYTDAYNNSETFTEVVNTSISNDSGVGLIGSGAYPNYSSTSASVNQTYSQDESGGSIIGEMGISAGFNHNYQTTDTVDQTYTGNLPPELAPVNSAATVFEYGYTGFSWESAIGTTPNFMVFDEAGLLALYDSLVGEQFNYFNGSNICAKLEMDRYCTGFGAGDVFISSDGYAVLSATTVVPVPAAVWLFGSGLIGLIGIARRKGARGVTFDIQARSF